jgi:hypothetical protein
MDYPTKILMIKELCFLEILDLYKLKFPDRNAQNYDELDAVEEEEFFECISEAINKLGNWCLELY